MNDVFKYVTHNDEIVVLEVLADDPLTVALHPYIDANYKYITVDRKDRYLTITKKDGSSWGYGAGTLISDGLRTQRKKVFELINNNCHIRI